jgi:hypothetical protein
MRSRFWWNLKEHSLEELESKAADVTTALDAARRSLTPASKEEILSALGSIASMMQVSLPDQDGLKLYLFGLNHLPSDLFKEACMRVTRTHKWPKLPLPAVFNEAVAKEMIEAQSLENYLKHAQRHTQHAIEWHKSKENKV